MARLTRKNIKVFAENATDNGVFGSLQANNPTTTSDVEQIQSLSAWSDGWNSATETSEMLPPLEEFQGVQYVTTYQQAYLMQEGIPEWAATVTYYKGSLTKEVTSTGFRIYNSLTDNNAGNLLSDTSNWKKVMDSDDLYAFDNSVVHKAGAETITGAKTFSVSPIVPTAASGDSSTKAASTEFVTTADSNLQNQINTKANTTDVVNLTGTQTITGSKTFYSNNRPLIVANPDVERGVTPASDIYTVIRYEDKSGNLMGVCESRQAADGAVDMRFNVWNGSDYSPYAMGLRRYSNGTEYGFCPPSDSVGSIVTTEGINKAANGYVKLGNGLIIQWGYSDIDGAQVTLPTPFSNTNYRICATYMKASGNLGSGYGHVITYPTYTTSFYANTEAGMYQWIAIGY